MSDLKNGKMQALSDDDLDQVSGGAARTVSYCRWTGSRWDVCRQGCVHENRSEGWTDQDGYIHQPRRCRNCGSEWTDIKAGNRIVGVHQTKEGIF